MPLLLTVVLTRNVNFIVAAAAVGTVDAVNDKSACPAASFCMASTGTA